MGPFPSGLMILAASLALVGASCSLRPESEINEFEARFDAAARDASGGTLDLHAVVPEIGWDRAVVLGCSDFEAMQDAVGVEWDGLAFIQGVGELCDYNRYADAIVFVKGQAVTGWGLTNMDDDGTQVYIDFGKKPAQVQWDRALFKVYLHLACISNCPAWNLEPVGDNPG